MAAAPAAVDGVDCVVTEQRPPDGSGADASFEKQSARGQYERVLDRIRTLVGGHESRRSEGAERPSVDGSSPLSEAVRSAE